MTLVEFFEVICYFLYFLIFVCFYYLMWVYLSHASLQPCFISHNVYSMAYVNVIAMMYLINKIVSKLLTITVWRKGGDFCFCLKKNTPVLVFIMFAVVVRCTWKKKWLTRNTNNSLKILYIYIYIYIIYKHIPGLKGQSYYKLN
jgi:hypothetical protein